MAQTTDYVNDSFEYFLSIVKNNLKFIEFLLVSTANSKLQLFSG